MLFFNERMVFLGYRPSLQQEISKRTSIPAPYVNGSRSIRNASVARRMSWAAGRETTREEDIAYCLMGMFNVNMPMLYGEGKKAFIRLQEEIMKVSDDQSLFAWRRPPSGDSNADQPFYHGLLADSPQWFEHSGRYLPQIEWDQRPSFQMTNRGLQIELDIVKMDIVKMPNDTVNTVSGRCYAATLECSGRPCIYLKKLSARSNLFARVDCATLGESRQGAAPQQICIPRDFSTAHDAVMDYFPTRIKVTNKSHSSCKPYSSTLKTAFYEGACIHKDLAAYPGFGGLLEIPCKWGASASVVFEIQPTSKPAQPCKYLEFTIGVTDEQNLGFSLEPFAASSSKTKPSSLSANPSRLVRFQNSSVKALLKRDGRREGGRIEYICDVVFEEGDA